MGLNKHRNKRNKYTYNGNKIIKKGEQELYSFIYERVWDLTEYDQEILSIYGLRKAKYVYVGSSSRYNLTDRSSCWRMHILNDSVYVAKHIRQFIRKLKAFYILETMLSATEIDNLLYYNATVITRAQSRETARTIERAFTTRYHYLDFYGDTLDTQYILLSKKDSNLKEELQCGAKALICK